MEENINEAPAEYVPVENAPPPGPPIKKILSFVIGFVVVLLILIVIFVVVIPRLSPKKQQDVTLTYWLVWEDPAPFQAAAAAFTKENPHIHVNIEKQDIKSLGNYIQRLQTRMANGTGPDVFRYHDSWVNELKPLLLPLPQSVVKADELDTKFYPTVAQDLKINGAYYGIPLHFDTLALFVNTDLFKNVGIANYPTTWDDLTSDAKQLTTKDANNKITTSGIALGTFGNISHASDIVSLLMVQDGADLKNLGGPTKQSAIDALKFYTFFSQGDSSVWDDTLENSTLAFAKGNLAMYIGYSWDIFQIKAINPDLQFTIVPIPHLSSTQDFPNTKSTIASYWVEGVASSTKHPQEAFEFLKFLASKTNMQNLYTAEAKTRLFGELYPRTDMASLLSSNTLIYPFVEQGNNARSTIFSSDTYDGAAVDSLNKYLGDAINSINKSASSPDSAVDTLSAGVAQVMGRSNAK